MANLGFPQFINFLLQPVPCLLISKLILTFAQFANFYPLFAQFVMCGLQILPTFSSFCLDVIFSTSSWPSFTATSRDLEIFRCLFQRSFALLQSFYGNFSLKMRVCLVTPLPYLATRGRACSLKLSYCNQILKLIRIKSNIISAQWSQSYMLGIVRFSNQDFNAWR